MFFKNPTKREAINGALLEGYHVSNPDSNFKLGSISGGYIQHASESKKSAFYILQGIGEVLVKGNELHNVEGGEIFELSENSTFKLDGQLKYIQVVNAAQTKIEEFSTGVEFPKDEKFFVYVIDGIGTLVKGNRKDVVREGFLIELTGDEVTTLKSTNMKCLISTLA